MNTGFERFFVEAVCRRIEKLGMTHRDFGIQLFGPKSGARLWLRVRNPNQSEQTRKLSLEDACRVASIFGMDFPSFVWTIYQERESIEHPKD